MKPKVLISLLLIVLSIAGGVYFYGKEKGKEKISIKGIATEADSIPSGTARDSPFPDTETPAAFISAYICGKVKEPGVYEIEKGSRVNDLLAAAGGFAEGASETGVNLARVVEDGEMIYIPDVSETVNVTDGSDGSEYAGLININTADKERLMSLPGIGETKAAAIIQYRNKNGSFTNIEEIKKVSGIGENIFSEIEALITV